MRYQLIIAYDGTAYCGWQVQKTGFSIQRLIQTALEKLLQHPVSLTGSGRTDKGVHANGQTAHFDTQKLIEPSRLRLAVNSLLPADIRILKVLPAASDFHARYSAFSKIYHYHLHLEVPSDPFTHPYRHTVRGHCDLNLIRKAIPHLLGTHDFTSFANHANKGSAARGAIRTLYRLDLIEQKGGVRLEFEANGFLYKMVRNITGLLLSVGANKISPEEVPKIIEAKTRKIPFKPAPAQGLFLHQVCYTPDILAKSNVSNDSK